MSPLVSHSRKGGAFPIMQSQFRRALGCLIARGQAQHLLKRRHYARPTAREAYQTAEDNHSRHRNRPRATHAIGRIDKSWRNHMILYHPKQNIYYINKVLCSQDRGRTVTIWFWVWDMHRFCSNEYTIVHSSRRRIELAFGK